ncbi:MAG TPA: autotransporter assembly complex family protein [Candidatus Krumholzibacteria bacterium]|nr:autotransporter assembly complex family protein [Candidatus Krumholzibacteria bacterium]
MANSGQRLERIPRRGRGAHFITLALVLLCSLSTGSSRASVKVELEGLTGELRDNVRATLSILQAKKDAPETRIRFLHSRAEDEIREALQPFGYYQPVTSSSLKADGDNWKARYVVDRGPQVHVASVDVQVLGAGAADSSFVALAKAFPLAKGDPLHDAAYERGKSQLLNYASNHGYFDAAFDGAAVLVTLATQRAAIVVHLDSGPRYLFGPVTVHQDVLEDRMVEGYVTMKPGDPYEVAPLRNMQNGLSTGPYFSTVEIRPEVDEADSLRVPVDVLLTPSRTQSWEFGLGYGTDTGVRGTAAARWRRLNRRGHHAEARVQASQIEYSASGQYFIPWPYPSTRLLSFFGGVGYLSPDWSKSWRVALGSSFAHSRWGWREVLSLAYEHEDFTIAQQDGISNLVLPEVSWTRIRADAPVVPSNGSRLRLDLKGAHESLLSSASFVQLRAEGKLIHTLVPRVRLIARGTAARTFTSSFSKLPPTLRFVTGGGHTVRGYRYQSLGPSNADGEIVGGNSLVIASSELELRFLKNWGVATFVDAGNAFDDFTGHLSVGSGIGLRWFSPIGIVRLDGAFGLSEPGHPFRVHISIGPDL